MSAPAIDRLNDALGGRYRLERELGEGGMATVYLADDLRHERKVALKVLKSELAAVVGAERFLSEIKTTANLQHPHILPLYDSGQADAYLFYVMPYVEGETLRARLDREKQLPVDEAVRVARAVATALDYAHRHGVIHRDIKPANVLMQDGEPVVADFGIALAVGAAGGTRLTETGLSLGTPYYMSPEQATGDQALGPAADIYALGAVLYEMLTGDPPYTGSTAQAVLGKIIQGGPVSATAVRATIPRNVDGALRKALERLPADRFPDAQAFSKALVDPGFQYGEAAGAGAEGRRRLWNPLSAALMATSVALAGVLLWPRAPVSAPRNVIRISAPFEAGEEPLAGVVASRFALTPDGSALVYMRQNGPETSLWLRRWDQLGATPIRGTEGGSWPAVSPDGGFLAFSNGTVGVRVIPLEGGLARTVAEGLAPVWGPDDLLYFWRPDGVYRIPATGGDAELLHARPEEWTDSRITNVLPGGQVALLQVTPRGQNIFGSATYALDLRTRELRSLVSGYGARYAPTGHLLFTTSDGTLSAAAFDSDAGILTGAAVMMEDRVEVFALAGDGTLFYNFAPVGENELELVWVDRNGLARPVDPGWTFDPSPVSGNRSWRLSPDGTRIALKAQTDLGPDIWIKPLPNGPLSRLTFYEGEDRFGRWSEDGAWVTFLSDRGDAMRLWRRRSDGTGNAELVLDREDLRLSEAYWVPGGEWLLLRAGGVGGMVGGRDIYAMHASVDTVVVPLVVTEFDESAVEFSTDGRWMAYQSNETGRREVYVRPFPDVDRGKWQVSTGSGRGPIWAHSGREIFYLTDAGEVMAASVDPGPPFAITGHEVLFTVGPEYYFANNTGTWDVAPDDEAFLMARSPATASGERTYRLVLNFFEELKARVPD